MLAMDFPSQPAGRPFPQDKSVFRKVAVNAFRAALLALLPAISAQAASPPPSAAQLPIQAELVQMLDAGRLKVGDPVFARVDVKWENPECKLRDGAILKGRIVSRTEHSKSAKTSEVAVLFETGQCGGKEMKPFPVTLAAVMAPDPLRKRSLFNGYQNQPLNEAVGLAVEGGLRSVGAAAQTAYYEPPVYSPPKAVLPGQVLGIGGVKLSVGTGPEGSSVLSASKRNVRLEPGSQFVLVPTPKAQVAVIPRPSPASAAPSTVASVTTTPPPAPAALADVTEICSPPQCSVAMPVTDADQPAGGASATVSVRDFGYPPRNDFEMAHFDYDSALTYLGPSQLLFTFNPHVLVPRTDLSASFGQLRLIRGVLLNLKKMKVEKTLEWRVPDGGQYLWSLGADRVLLHVGRELRLYGPGLKLEQKFSLAGPLAYVRVSPSAKYVAVGVIHERHSEAVHRQLEEAEGHEPEEDVDLKVLDSAFHVLASVTRSSREMPPVLSDEGEIRLLSHGANRYRIVELSWIGEKRVLAQVHSTCLPELASVPGDLLFVVGCDRQQDGKWYRVLRPDGKPVLKGWSPSDELQQTIDGRTGAFAVGIAEIAKPLAPDSVFRPTDLKSEHIGIYRSTNGRRILALSITPPVPTVQTFALAPGGRQLAVLHGDRIALYSLPDTTASK